MRLLQLSRLLLESITKMNKTKPHTYSLSVYLQVATDSPYPISSHEKLIAIQIASLAVYHCSKTAIQVHFTSSQFTEPFSDSENDS